MDIVGVVDSIAEHEITGWVYCVERPHEHLHVVAQFEGVDVGSSIAKQFREDLQRADVGDGDHGFTVVLSRRLNAGLLRQIVVRASSDEDGAMAELPLPEPTEAGRVREKLDRVLRYASTYADASEVLSPVSYPRDFIAQSVPPECRSWVTAGEDEIRRSLERDECPIPQLANREGYAEGNDFMYWLSGYSDYRMLQDLAKEHGVTGGRYFDFGGSTGRVFRNFALQSDAWDVWSSDFKISSVEFNLEYFPPKIRAFLNGSLPTLPLPDGYFDLITACSVFTHIDETENGWLLELRRILKIGGIACISIHNGETWTNMSDDLFRYVVQFRPDIADLPELPAGRTVVTFRHDDPYRCQTFHTDQYIRRHWGRFFEICAIRPLSLGEQAMVVCRRFD